MPRPFAIVLGLAWLVALGVTSGPLTSPFLVHAERPPTLTPPGARARIPADLLRRAVPTGPGLCDAARLGDGGTAVACYDVHHPDLLEVTRRVPGHAPATRVFATPTGRWDELHVAAHGGADAVAVTLVDTSGDPGVESRTLVVAGPGLEPWTPPFPARLVARAGSGALAALDLAIGAPYSAVLLPAADSPVVATPGRVARCSAGVPGSLQKLTPSSMSRVGDPSVKKSG